ncbi:MAG TPA: hypothetical protein DEA71_06995 [Nitrospira sp.]|nr:hypothetical protein [Nitrospira sp.]
MDTHKLIEHIDRLIVKTATKGLVLGLHAEACEFLRSYAGPKSAFCESLKELNPRQYSEDYVAKHIQSVLQSFKEYVEGGLYSGISPERRAQIDVVSDFLQQAQQLLDSKGIHPASPAVIIGAALEEFLRTWTENQALGLGNRKPGLDAYAAILKDADLITKQDHKDITSWAGLRNHAAHGEWDEVNDKSRVALMLEGVNLFMRKYFS